MCGWVPSAGQVSLSVSVGWGDTTFHATMSLEMYSNIELIVSMGHALIWSGMDERRSQLLPTEKTSSIGLQEQHNHSRGSHTRQGDLDVDSSVVEH